MIKAEDKETDKQINEIGKWRTRILTRWTRGLRGWTRIRRRGPKDHGSRLCLLETVTELGLRNLLFVYFLFGGWPGVGKVVRACNI